MSGYSEHAKRHGIKLELHWWVRNKRTGNGCWRKKFNGQQLYFNHPNTKAGYETAVLEYARKKLDRPNAAVWKHHRLLFEKVAEYHEHFGTDDSKLADAVTEFLSWIDGFLNGKAKLPERIPVGAFTSSTKRPAFSDEFIGKDFSDFGMLSYKLPDKWQDRISRLQPSMPVKRVPQTIAYWAEDLLRQKKMMADAKQRSQRTVKDARQKLKVFRDWIGDTTHVNSINSETWKGYSQELFNRNLKTTSIRGYLNSAKEFIEYCVDDDACNLEHAPKRLRRRSMIIRDIEDVPNDANGLIWSKREFHDALQNLPNEWQAWLLLMLNCGYTQTDLNELKHSEYRDGRIIRRRTKTKRQSNPPVVNYKLWDATVDAIENVKSEHGEFVLLTERGARLTSASHDNVSRNWQCKRKRIGLDGKELRGIRKTGSTTLKQHSYLGWTTGLYLGHSGDIKDRHYDAKDGRIYKPLDEAIVWLGEQFGIN